MKQFVVRHAGQLLLTVLAFIVTIQALSLVAKSEPDPIHIEPINGIETFTGTYGDEFTFDRHVCVTKDTIVTVHREFHDVETGHKYMMPSISYVGYAKDGCFDIEFAANIPGRIPPGVYDYRPILIYSVNESLQVSKPAPPVRVTVEGD